MTDVAALVKAKMLGHASCAGCQYLMRQDEGYSNWTVTDTSIHCLLRKNPNLPAAEPWDWKVPIFEDDVFTDNWPATQASRCLEYVEGTQIHMDVDCERREFLTTTEYPIEVLNAYEEYTHGEAR